MGCMRCQERRELIGAASRAATAGDISGAARQLLEVSRTMGEDAERVMQAGRQRLAAAHARLKRS